MTYWTPGWPLGFGGDPAAGQNANTYGNFPGLDGGDAGGGRFSHSRYHFSNGWFVGGEGGRMGLTGVNQAFGDTRSFEYQGVQFGYNFQAAGGLPVAFYAGVDTLKYNMGIGNALAPFDSVSGTLPGYSAHAGVEFKPTSNVSIGLGFGYTQQSTRIDSDVNSLTRPGDSAFAIIGRP